jgi:hypothetical protein
LVIYKTPESSNKREFKLQKKNSKGLIGRRYNLIRADKSKAKSYGKSFSPNQNLRFDSKVYPMLSELISGQCLLFSASQ